MRKRPERETLVLLAGLAATMAGCSSHDDGQWRVCTDAQGRRLPDFACEQNGPAYHGSGWVFISHASSAPPVGQVVTGGSPRAAGTVFAAPAQGITRGGFGSTGEEAGAGHGVGE